MNEVAELLPAILHRKLGSSERLSKAIIMGCEVCKLLKALMRTLFDPTTLEGEDFAFLMKYGYRPNVYKSWLTQVYSDRIETNGKDWSKQVETESISTIDMSLLVEQNFHQVPLVSYKHQNISFQEVFNAMKGVVPDKEMRRYLAILCNAKCMVDSSAAAFLLSMCVSTERAKIAEILELSQVLSINNEKMQVKRLGDLHTVVRSTGLWLDGTVLPQKSNSQIQYIKELMSRRVYDPNIWEDDIGQRLRPGPTKRFFTAQKTENGANIVGSAKEFKRRLGVNLESLLGRCSNRWAQSLKTMDDFWGERHVWVASGAAPKFKTEIKVRTWDPTSNSPVEKVIHQRLNKRAAFENLTLDQLKAEWRDTPYLFSNGALKHENGKLRTLYNTPMSHYVAQGFVLEQLEPLLSELPGYDLNFVDEQALDALRQRLEGALKGRAMWMWDYTDFNVQHENDDMSMVWLVIHKILGKMEVFGDYKKQAVRELQEMCLYIARAEQNVWITSPGGAYAGMKVRGLLTGSRATQFINTLLNIAYMQILQEQYDELFAVRPIQLSFNHGDDVFAFVEDRTASVILTHMARVMGLAGNVNKIARSFGEFLRIRYDDEGMRGHLQRSIANIITRDWQSGEEYTPEEKIKSVISQVRRAVTRGAVEERILALQDSEVRFHRRITVPIRRYDSQLGKFIKVAEKVMKIPKISLYTSTVNGGFGLIRKTRDSTRLLQFDLPKKRIKVSIPKWVRESYGNEMTNDFWKKMHAKFPTMKNADIVELAQLKHTFKADNIMGSLPSIARKIMKRSYTKQMAQYIAEVNDQRFNDIRGMPAKSLTGMYLIDLMKGAINDLQRVRKFWLRPEINLYQYGINPMTTAEREVAKLPGHRKDVLRLWGKALSKTADIDLFDAMLQVAAMVSEGGSMANVMFNLTSGFTREMATKITLGLIPFDDILSGFVCTEAAQLLRDTAIWRTTRAMREHAKIIDDKRQLQMGVRCYEETCKTMLCDVYTDLLELMQQ